MSVSRRLLLGALAVAVLGAAACGGDSSEPEPDEGAAAVVETDEPTAPVAAGPEGSIADLLAQGPGEDVAVIWGTAHYSVGSNRLSFLVVDSSGELIEAPGASVRVAQGGFDALPELEATAENLPVGSPVDPSTEGDFDAPSVYVANLELDEPGMYTLLVEPEGSDIQAFGQIEVAAESSVPAVGQPAVSSDTPTLEDGFPEDLTTATPPDVELLQYSIKQSLEDQVPFVVTFATPKFCASRVCGPVVDIVDEVRQRVGGDGVRFIHVEVFEANDPERGVNQWMQEWNLPTEPWTFLVDETGTIRARFEGLVTVGELEQSVRDHLL
jgi:hypothetical protein